VAQGFIHIASAQDVALMNVRVFLDALTPAGDFVTFAPGTTTDTEDQITSRPYGIGTLNAATAAGATNSNSFVKTPPPTPPCNPSGWVT
jgi:hypothetical protein